MREFMTRTSTHTKRKRRVRNIQHPKTTDRRLQVALTAVKSVVIGPILLMKLHGGRVWLGNMIGEGMECDEARLGRVLERFFNANF